MKIKHRISSTALLIALVPMTVLSLVLPIVAHAQLVEIPGPQIFIDDAEATEGIDGDLVFTVGVFPQPPESSTGCVEIDYSTAAGSSTAGEDYTETSDTLLLHSGNGFSSEIAVPVIDDSVVENDETLVINLANSETGGSDCAAAEFGRSQGTGTIHDNDVPSVSIDDPSVEEGDEGTTDLTFTITSDPAPSGCSEVDWAITGGTAERGSDYDIGEFEFATGSVFLFPDSPSSTVTVSVLGDTELESDETIEITLSQPSSEFSECFLEGTITKAVGTGTILNDDTEPELPAISVLDAEVVEGDEEDSFYDLIITIDTLEGFTGGSVRVSTENGTASGGSDYFAFDEVFELEPPPPVFCITCDFIEIEPSEPSAIIVQSIGTVHGDTMHEPDENFFINLSDPQGVALADGRAEITILNDDRGVSIDDPSVVEGDDGTTDLTFTITSDPSPEGCSQVDWEITGGSADSETDYSMGESGTSGSVFLFDEFSSDTVTATVFGDAEFESDETIEITLSAPDPGSECELEGSLTKAVGTGSIINDDEPPFTPPIVSIGDATVTEGDTGTTDFQFPVSLSAASPLTTVVNFATSDGTATSAADYVGQSAALSFAPGETSKNLSVAVTGDVLDEADETLFVDLTSAANAIIRTAARATGTIVDDDDPPVVSVGDASVTEGPFGTTTTVALPVTLSAPSAKDISVGFATADQSATAGDYQPATGGLAFAPGVTTHSVSVVVVGDSLDEADETLVVSLSGATNATIAEIAGTGTILDDDSPPAVSLGNVSVTEGDSGTTPATFTVKLSVPSGLPTSLDYATRNGSATAPADYQFTSGTLAFEPGQTTKTITAQVRGDDVEEIDETFGLRLETSPAGNLARATIDATATILNDDDPEEEGEEGDEIFGTRIFNPGDTGGGTSDNDGGPDGTGTDGDDPGTDDPDDPDEEGDDVPGPTVARLSSPSTEPGGDVTLAGSGCGPNSAVPITLDGDNVATARADAAGSFEITFASPSDLAIGRHELAAECGDDTIATTIDAVLTSNQNNAAAAPVIITVLGLFIFLLFEGTDLIEQERGEGRHGRRRRLFGGMFGGPLEPAADGPSDAASTRVALPALPRLHVIGAVALVVVAALVSFVRIGAPAAPSAVSPGAFFVADTDLGAGDAVLLDVEEPIAVTFADLPPGAETADGVRLAFSVAGIELTDGDAPLVRSGDGGHASVDASARGFLMAGAFTGTLELTDDGAVVHTRTFAAESEVPIHELPAGQVTAGVLLFALAGLEFVLRRLRRGQTVPGGKFAAAGPGIILGIGIVGFVSIVLSQEPTVATIAAAGVIGGVAGLVLGHGATDSTTDQSA